jgi:hypothetical protein
MPVQILRAVSKDLGHSSQRQRQRQRRQRRRQLSSVQLQQKQQHKQQQGDTLEQQWQDEGQQEQQQGHQERLRRPQRRRLGYEGKAVHGAVVVAKDTSSPHRHVTWRSYLKGNTYKRFADSRPPLAGDGGGGGSNSGVGGPAAAPTAEVLTVAQTLKGLEPRLRRFGYSVLEPGKPRYAFAGDQASDAFAHWAVVVVPYKK